MALKPKDPLLAVARLCTTALMMLCAVCTVALMIAGLVLVLLPTVLHDAMANSQAHAQAGDAAALLTPAQLATEGGIVLLIAAMLAAGFQFARLLRRIIDSVGAGDPFVPINATRLAQMGWLLVVSELITLPIGALAEWLGKRDQAGDLTADIDLSVSSLFVALVLFILARVFREGARMRSDLEGTV